ncbi:SRR1-like protein isoform X1 [Halichondria panicea]|uniref:SRR1-like protein isoform X1 n=1 Tax=Halichondria panicea TaxID=6063 RepID=UPI00312B7D26
MKSGYVKINMAKSRDEDGFQIVRRRRGQRSTKPPLSPVGLGHLEEGLPSRNIIIRIDTYRNSIRQSQFLQQIQDGLDCSKFREFICYGIGRIGSCSISRQQLALLLELCPKGTPCSLFDPMLSSEEREAVERTGCSLLPHNELCKHPVHHSTLFFMPHCGRAMYNNLLWSNWSPTSLPCVTIIGNRLSSYLERLPTKHLAKETPYIHRALQYSTEVTLSNTYPDSTVFNDLAIHTFPVEKLLTAQHTEWTDCTEPIIDSNDPEIIVT